VIELSPASQNSFSNQDLFAEIRLFGGTTFRALLALFLVLTEPVDYMLTFDPDGKSGKVTPPRF